MLVKIIVPRGTTIEVVEAAPVRVIDVDGEEVPPPYDREGYLRRNAIRQSRAWAEHEKNRRGLRRVA